jgi:hypothetical protein
MFLARNDVPGTVTCLQSRWTGCHAILTFIDTLQSRLYAHPNRHTRPLRFFIY